jgi:hypothetical protein
MRLALLSVPLGIIEVLSRAMQLYTRQESKYHIQTQNRQVLTRLSIYGYFGARGRVHRQPQGMSSRNSAIRTVNRIRSQKPGQRNDISARGLRCS